jgi:hypothetical protein
MGRRNPLFSFLDIHYRASTQLWLTELPNRWLAYDGLLGTSRTITQLEGISRGCSTSLIIFVASKDAFLGFVGLINLHNRELPRSGESCYFR